MSKYKLDKSAQVVENQNYTMTQKEVCERLNDLETKLAETQELKQQLENIEESYNRTMRYLNKTRSELLNLPNKIVEEITNELSNNTSLYFEMRESTSAHCPNKEYEWFNYVRFRNYINTILKK